MLFDLDHFKVVNDAYGHSVGDAVLQAVASTVRDNLRSSDLLARLGGDEFVVLLVGTPTPEAEGLAERLRALIHADPIKTDHNLIYVTMSVGITLLKFEADHSLRTLMQEADQALYHAKHRGRNQTVVWDDSLAIVEQPGIERIPDFLPPSQAQV